MQGRRTPRTLSEAVGRVINARRKELGITLNEFAIKTRMSSTSIRSHSRGRHSPSLSTLEEYAHALGLDVVEVLSRARDLLANQAEAAE